MSTGEETGNSSLIMARTSSSMEDPYFVSNSEQIGVAIVSKKLIGHKNYNSWRRAMEIALSDGSKLGFVLGKYPKPEDENLQAKWQRCNDIVMLWLISSVAEEIIGEIIYSEDVATAWEILQVTYGGHNLAIKSALKKELSNITQGETSVAEYYQKLSVLWQELDSMKVFKCPTGKDCLCCKAAELERREDRICQFFMGLNDHHASVRTNVNAMKEVPKLSIVYELALQEELLRKTQKPAVEQLAT